MDYILYFMPELWNSTQTLNFRGLDRHIRSLTYVFYKLPLTRSLYGIQNITYPAHFFWSVNYARSRINCICSGSILQIFSYTPIEQTIFVDTYRINFLDQKMVLQGNICISLEEGVIMILERLLIFVRKTTSKSQPCSNVNTRMESRRRKHKFVTTLVFGCSNDVGNTTLWQRFDKGFRDFDQ